MSEGQNNGMDERWLKALKAKNIVVRVQTANDDEYRIGDKRKGTCKTTAHVAFGTSMQRAQPFKATGHKGGISRQGS
ncbi:hypothetical protein [Bifidobacterium olomucense]|uniref:Uncharacterized protein n=1 Tax=Bifidobacterium olomucense TaxID=2675324 RepID=A0A7Y0EYW5_9BIFI|nr:hypothetical protein [Bifidobacterium sp. DSM 109959]NMM97886.1 hypothetical protein [Bifidobacterium sp. DSM 109959]